MYSYIKYMVESARALPREFLSSPGILSIGSVFSYMVALPRICVYTVNVEEVKYNCHTLLFLRKAKKLQFSYHLQVEKEYTF